MNINEIANKEKVLTASTEFYCKDIKEYLHQVNTFSEMLVKWKNNQEEDALRDYELITDEDKKYIKVTFFVQPT